MAIYFKITNHNECHHGYQYHDGLNVLVGEFNKNPKDSCCSGGLYFTTIEHIHIFYYIGVNLRIITLPTEDPKFEMVKDPKGDKWRANQIILGEKYSLDDLETYTKFNIPYPDLYIVAKNNLLNMAKFLLEKSKFCMRDKNQSLFAAAREGNTEMVLLLLDNGADIHSADDYALETSIIHKKLDMIKILVDNGANININNGYGFREAVRNGSFDIVKYLVDKGVDIHFGNDMALAHAVWYKQFDIAKFLIESGCNVDSMGRDIKHDLQRAGLLVGSEIEIPL